MKKLKILMYFSTILFLSACGASKKAGSSDGEEGKSAEFVDLHYTEDVVREKIPLAALQHAQYRLSKKIVYTSSGWTKGAYTDESGNIILPDKSKLYQLIYDENLPGLYDLSENKGSNSTQSFNVDFATTIKGPTLKMSSTGGLYFPPKTFQWAGRTWKANDVEGVNLMVRFIPDAKEDIVPIKLDGKVLGGGGESSQEQNSNSEDADSILKEDSVIKDTTPTQSQPKQQSQPQSKPKNNLPF